MQKSYCYTPGVSVGVRMQNVRANVRVLEFKSFCIFSCILTLLIILIKALTTKAYDRGASGDCGTSGPVSYKKVLLAIVSTLLPPGVSVINNHILFLFSYSKTERTQKAIECYRKSLKINPLLWTTFEKLCLLGELLFQR